MILGKREVEGEKEGKEKGVGRITSVSPVWIRGRGLVRVFRH